jgi:ABC-type polar amino acid transport system ATPase subunit
MPFRAGAAAADSQKYEMAPKEFFNNPKSERTKLFLSQILHH